METNNGHSDQELLEMAQNAAKFNAKDTLAGSSNSNGSVSNHNIQSNGSNEPKTGFKKVARAWLDLEDNFSKEEITEEENESDGDPDPDEAITPLKKPVTRQAALASATTMVQGLDLMQSTLFYLVEVIRYKKSFRNYDWKKVKNILYEERAKLSPEDQALFDLVVKRQKKFTRRKDAIRMGADELKQRKEAFFEYYQETGKTIDPSWGLWINIITSLGQKGIDVAFDDGY